MLEKIKFGSVTQEHRLDEQGSTLRVETRTDRAVVQPVKLSYQIRHKIENPGQESDIYRIFDERHARYPIFDSGITFEKKNRLNKTGSYYMIEHFTMYRKPDDNAHVKAFIESEKKELGL